MSGTIGSLDDGPQDLAGEYVLGTLDAAEMAAAERRAAADAAFAAEIRFWEGRLNPLAMLVPPVAPPANLWQRIEATTGGGAVPGAANDNALRFWRAAALAGLAIAAGLAVFVTLRPPPPPAFAVLAPAGSTTPLLIAMAVPGGAIDVRPSATLRVAADRDLQLWSLPAGAPRPISLGVLPAAGKQIPPGIAPGTQLLVSLEPKGGSPTGQPTGPVVYGGTFRVLQ